MNIRISIIIPTINRYTALLNTLRDLEQQNMDEYEIIVIDQTPPEERTDPAIILTVSPKILYIWSETTSASAARNTGLRMAQADVVLFLDDDVKIERTDFLRLHLGHYQNSTIPGVVGGVLGSDRVTRTNKHIWTENPEIGWLFFPSNYDKQAWVKSGASCNLSVRKQWAVEVGGMNENYEKGAHREESDFSYRLCDRYGLLLFDPECYVIHLKVPMGGIRSWNRQVPFVKAQHHYDGAIYFLLTAAVNQYWPVHFVMTLRFLFYQKEILRSPKWILVSMFRLVKGIYHAVRLKLKGPKYLSLT